MKAIITIIAVLAVSTAGAVALSVSQPPVQHITSVGVDRPTQTLTVQQASLNSSASTDSANILQ